MRSAEGSEQRLKQQLQEKEQQFEEYKLDSKKKFNAERRRFEQQGDAFKKTKEEANKKHALILQDVIISTSNSAIKPYLI